MGPSDESGRSPDAQALYRLLAARRDVRAEFTGGAVTDEVLGRVLAAGHAAPSVGNSMPWDFVVVRDPAIKAVVAVACEKELADGIRAVIPKRVIAIPNERPNGPCKNIRVNTAAVRAAIQELLGAPG